MLARMSASRSVAVCRQLTVAEELERLVGDRTVASHNLAALALWWHGKRCSEGWEFRLRHGRVVHIFIRDVVRANVDIPTCDCYSHDVLQPGKDAWKTFGLDHENYVCCRIYYKGFVSWNKLTIES